MSHVHAAVVKSIRNVVWNNFKKFPDYYKAPFNYKQAIEELKKYIDEVEKKISVLEIINVKNKDKMFAYFRSKDIRKCLNL